MLWMDLLRRGMFHEEKAKKVEFAEEMCNVMKEVRKRHPVAEMNEEEFSAKLRETREMVSAERHERRTKSLQTDE